jgi:hypothetical protein
MSPVRDTVSTVDQRAVTLAQANHTADRWANQRPDTRAQGQIPRALRAKGYEPVADLIGAWTGTPIDIGTVRSWWRFDMNRGASNYLPPPDAIIKRKGGTLLPGWADETIREWLARVHPRFKKDMINMKTYLAWDETHDEIDPRVVALLEGNAAYNTGPLPLAKQRREYMTRDDYSGTPEPYLALGYDFAARVITDAQGHHIADNTVCKYWREDLKRRDVDSPDEYIDPYSWRMPEPDAIISRGPRDDLMPGWTEATLREWVPTRPGPGNRTTGVNRRSTGLIGMRKIGVDEKGRKKFGRIVDTVDA